MILPFAHLPNVPVFKKGDVVVYPRQGVSKVLGIEMRESLPYYQLRVLGTEKKIRVLVEKASENGIRPVVGRNDIALACAIMREKVSFLDSLPHQRKIRFDDNISTGSIYDAAEVVRDLVNLKALYGRLSLVEHQLLDAAKKFIATEWAFVTERPVEDIERKIWVLCLRRRRPEVHLKKT